MEKRKVGYVTDAVTVFERVRGQTLAELDLLATSVEDRQRLLHRVGRLLREVEHNGLYLYDSKASNWIVFPDELRGLTPLLIDVDGLRPFRVAGGGFARLLRSLRAKAGFGVEEETWVSLGYRPYATRDRLPNG